MISEGIPRAVVIGATGGIGIATAELLLKLGFIVTPVYRVQVDLTAEESVAQISKILTDTNPDIVINCAGVFGLNDIADYDTTFDVNVRSSWAVIKHYMDNPSNKTVDVVFVGSTAYDHGRKNYMLYSASKSAQHNLFEGAAEFFSDTQTKIHIVHPARTRTPMVAPFNEKLDYLEPQEVALAIGKCLDSANGSKQILTLGKTNEQKNWTFR
jgi:NAD(P)-dependent dehydrogenase (short-subunit alcohol dehydrogenase family)